MEHRNSSNVILNTDNMFSRKFKDMFPITNNDEILKEENSLNDHDFYQYEVRSFYIPNSLVICTCNTCVIKHNFCIGLNSWYIFRYLQIFFIKKVKPVFAF